MNLPNTITFVRVVLIPVFIGLMSYGYYRIALFVYVAACLTDALDGLIARLTNTKTELGAFLDPMADKLLIVTSFVTLALLISPLVPGIGKRRQKLQEKVEGEKV